MLGGTFDPVHVAHIFAAAEARHRLRLDRVLFVVANVPWQNSDRNVTSAEDRFAMVTAALDGTEGLEGRNRVKPTAVASPTPPTRWRS